MRKLNSIRPKEKFVRDVFENIAPKYDLMNDIISFRRHKSWRKFTMRKMAMPPDATAIDLCCGTCDWTIAMAQASPKGTVVGLDFSERMLEVGHNKVKQAQVHDRVELVHGNAMALPFADNHFDYATIGFGLRNVPDIEQVLREMTRVVRPGGKVVCLELSKPVWQPFKSIYYFYFEKLMPLIGKWIAGRYDQYKWLPESLAAFPDHVRLAEMFREAGLENVEVYPFTGGVAALHIGEKG